MKRVRVVTGNTGTVKATITVQVDTKQGALQRWEVDRMIDSLADSAMQSMKNGALYLAVPLSRIKVK